MIESLRRWSSRLPLLALALAAGCGAPVDEAAVSADAVRAAPAFPPESHPYGRSYADWGDRWVQWIFAQPATGHPMLDLTGERCGVGQRGPVWFLGGSVEGVSPLTRRCTVPRGKALFFPIVNAWADNVGVDPPVSADTLRGWIAGYIYPAQELAVTVDGVPVRGLDRYHFVSERPFSYELPLVDNLQQHFGLEASGHVEPAVSDGYWVMLPPLSPGAHELRFRAVGALPFVVVDVTYQLTVARDD